MSELQTTPIEYSALNLCRYAGDVREESELSGILDELSRSPLIVVRCLAGKIAVDTAISRRDLLATCRAAVRHAKDLVYSARSKAAPDLLFLRGQTAPGIALGADAVNEVIKRSMLSCLLAMVAENGWFPSGMDAWDAVAPEEFPSDLHPWLKAVASSGRMTIEERWMAFLAARTAADKYSVLLFAISLADNRDAPNQQIGHCHVTLFQAVQNGALPPTCASNLLTIFVRCWSEIAQQAFRLENLRLTLPDLQAARLSSDQGLQKAGRLLLAGLPAVGLHIPDWLCEVLKGSSNRTP